MALVSYSDSDGSDDEQLQSSAKQAGSTRTAPHPTASFAVDRSNPRKIQVKLQETKVEISNSTGSPDAEPSAKRQRVGGGVFSGFNSLLPAPKKETQTQNGSGAPKGQSRRIFSLKTGAERGFDRESDAELRQMFAEQHNDVETAGTKGTEAVPQVFRPQSNLGSPPVSICPQLGRPMMFKPLSVTRKPPRRNPSTRAARESPSEARAPLHPASEQAPKPTPKISLFSTGSELPTSTHSPALASDYKPLIHDAAEENTADPSPESVAEKAQSISEVDEIGNSATQASTGPQSLDAIASDLNLSASARRQLFGRKSGASTNAVNVINFNTDKEYAANEVLRASGEQIQHNPVRGPASGKHSLKQLVNMASGQKDALEESFATGRQNKKEAGSRYGW